MTGEDFIPLGNRHNAARDILLTEARMEKLERDTPTCIRQKREYTKRNRRVLGENNSGNQEATVFGRRARAVNHPSRTTTFHYNF